jgi:hypothetical protein
MAQRDSADVLSADRDFYRYIGRKFSVFYEYDVENRKLLLFPRGSLDEKPKKGVLMRELQAINDADIQNIRV